MSAIEINWRWVISVHEASHCCAALAMRQPMHSVAVWEGADGGIEGEFRSLPPGSSTATHRQSYDGLCEYLRSRGQAVEDKQLLRGGGGRAAGWLEGDIAA